VRGVLLLWRRFVFHRFFKTSVTTAFATALLFGMKIAHAQYPTKSVTMIVGYPAGGSVDLAGRTIAAELSKRMGQPFVVDNIGGAGGTIGAQRAVSAAADGYTLLLGTNSEIAIAKLTNNAIKYDGTKDLTPIGMIGTQPMLLAAKVGLGVKSIDELVALAKKSPGKLNYGSAGVSTPLHLAGEMVNQIGGVQLNHVPYKGAAPMVTDLLGGNIELGMFVLSSGLPHVRSGKIVPLGITESKRSASAPDIPTLNESKALEGLDMGIFFGVFAPAKTDRAIAERLEKEIMAALADPEVTKKLTDAGVNVRPTRGADFGKLIAGEVSKYRKVVDLAKIRE
jgi:tripartite-type tricarboxylate transporter receptor subunit TctC